MHPEEQEKYSRQILFAGMGESGQERLLKSRAVLIGCGALGTMTANFLVRSGLGHLRIIDRDFVEWSNLQRQTLFEEQDAKDTLPKAIAAERRLRAANSGVKIEGLVADLTPDNASALLSDFDIILDGTDNFDTRFLLNDVAISLGIPWIYAAAVGSYGITMTIRSAETACLACLLETGETSPGPGVRPGLEDTCDTAGVLNAAVGVIASIQTAEAIKLLARKDASLTNRLISYDVWSGKFQSIRVARNPDCRCCAHREFNYLQGQALPHVTMCGRDSVQIHEHRRGLDLAELGRRLASSASDIRHTDFLLRFQVPPYEVTVFPDGRALIKGTQDPVIARSLYARLIGT